jgi:translation initiation factor 1
MFRGLTSTTEDRKVLLKEMKTKLGGGGTLVEGVIELQGSHADMILSILLKKGYSKTKKIGK